MPITLQQTNREKMFNHLKITAMKKIIIAALIGAMLMPAEMMASNDRGRRERPRVEQRGGKRGGGKEHRGYHGKRGGDRGHRGDKVIIVNKPHRPRYNSHYCPPPPPPRRHHHCHHNDVADAIGAAATLVGLIGIVSAVSQ